MRESHAVGALERSLLLAQVASALASPENPEAAMQQVIATKGWEGDFPELGRLAALPQGIQPWI